MTNNEPITEDEILIFEGLETIRRRRGYVWSTILGFVPAILITRLIFGSDTGLIAALVMILLHFVAGIAHGLTPCPRCNNKFNSKGWYSNPMTRRCLNCKLKLKATLADLRTLETGKSYTQAL